MLIQLKNLRCTRGNGSGAFTIRVPGITIARGDLIAITGPSGSGKSTLLEMLGLALSPTPDSIFYWQMGSGKPIDIVTLWRDQRERELCRLRSHYLGFVLQTGGLLPYLTVQENITLPRLLAGKEGWNPEMDSMVKTLDIMQLLAKKPHQLSIGERQRASVGRALAHDPLLLLADEPTSALDPEHAEAVMSLMVRLITKRRGIAVIVTHDYELIQRLGLRQVQANLLPGGGISHISDAG